MNWNLMDYLWNRKWYRYQQVWMQTYYEEVQNMYQQMRAWRHDYKNHLQVMRAHLELGNYQQLGAYMEQLDEELTQIEQVIKTGNIMLDAILNSKISLARSKGIAVNVKVLLPKHLSVSEYDLGIILGNLLDNAIEGCETQMQGERRFLRVYLGVLKEQLYLSVTNSHAAAIKGENGHYPSTKAVQRGLGLLNVDRMVKKNRGFVNRQHDEGLFATEVLLPLS